MRCSAVAAASAPLVLRYAGAWCSSPSSTKCMTRTTVQQQHQSTSLLSQRLHSSVNNNVDLINTVDATLDWDDRIGLQSKFDNASKGWKVQVEWRPTPYGAGCFAKQDIAKETILRVGIRGVNLYPIQSIQDIDAFCSRDEQYTSRLNFVRDYLWGFCLLADDQGHLPANETSSDDWFYGMWIPGNGLNHSPETNMVYRATPEGINLVALTDIAQDEEIVDDYKRHGSAPKWLIPWAKEHQVALNFQGCNDFV